MTRWLLTPVPRVLSPSGRYVWQRMDFPPGANVIQYDREELSERCGRYQAASDMEDRLERSRDLETLRRQFVGLLDVFTSEAARPFVIDHL